MDQFGHKPVLLKQVLDMLAPSGSPVIVDCTAGLGGHSQALLEAAGPEARGILIDLDEGNLRQARERLSAFGSRVRYFAANFGDVKEVLEQAEVKQVDILLADLGIASTQLDDPLRGLSFQAEGPLDMRLDRSQHQTAGMIVNSYGEEELANLIFAYGEERYSRRIAHAIVLARKKNTIDSTRQLADVIYSAYPAVAKKSRHGVHPATRTFQALRIAVNQEMKNLERLLAALPDVLKVGGKAAIISFHSLEDRQVKQAFAAWEASGRARLLTRKPIQATDEEANENPRSRSAKLRGIEKLLG